MTHFTDRLPQQVEVGAIRHLTYSNEVVKTDGGAEVRNARWSAPLRSYEISFPTAVRTDPTYLAVIALYDMTLGGTHTFDYAEWTDNTQSTIIKVRFDSPLSIQGVDIKHDHIETLTIVEVR